MIFRCDCVVMTKHSPRCSRDAVKRCTRCGDKVCGPCARNHHAHDKFEDLKDVFPWGKDITVT